MAEKNEEHGEKDKLCSFEEVVTLSLLRNKIYYENCIYKSKLLENENNALNEELKMLKGQVAAKEEEVILRKHLLESDSTKYEALENTTIFLSENEERAKAKFKRNFARVKENRRIQEAQIVKISEILKKRKEHPLMQPWVRKLEDQEKMLKEYEEIIGNLERNLKERQAEFFRFQRDSIKKRKDGVIPTNIILQNFNLLVVEIAKNKLESINLEKEAAKLKSDILFLNRIYSSNKNSLQVSNTLNSFFPEPAYDAVQSKNYLDRFTSNTESKIPSANPITVTHFLNQLSQKYSNIANNTAIQENKVGTNLTSFAIDQNAQTDSLVQSCGPSACITYFTVDNKRDFRKGIEDTENDSIKIVSNDSQHIENIQSSGSQSNEAVNSPQLFGSQTMETSFSQHLNKSQPIESALSQQINNSQPMVTSPSQEIRRSQPTETSLSQQFDKSRLMGISFSQQLNKSQPMTTSFSQQNKRSQPMETSLSQQFKKSRPIDSRLSQPINRSQPNEMISQQSKRSCATDESFSLSQPINRSQLISQQSKRSCATDESFSLGQPIQFEPTQGSLQALNVSKGYPETSAHDTPNSGSNNSFIIDGSSAESSQVPHEIGVDHVESYSVTYANLLNPIPLNHPPKKTSPLHPVNNSDESPSCYDHFKNMLGFFSPQAEHETANSTNFRF